MVNFVDRIKYEQKEFEKNTCVLSAKHGQWQ